MDLKEARKLVADLREWPTKYLPPMHDAVMILDNRITKLEAQRDEIPFRELLDWLMCSDPWPGGNEDIIKKWINLLAVSKGYKDWIGAFHKE